MKPKALLLVMAALEVGAGAVLLATPQLTAGVLFGLNLEGPLPALGRLLGAALLGIGLACWMERGSDPPPRSLVVTLLAYNVGVPAILVPTALSAGLGAASWGASALHGALAVWCALLLRTSPPAAR